MATNICSSIKVRSAEEMRHHASLGRCDPKDGYFIGSNSEFPHFEVFHCSSSMDVQKKFISSVGWGNNLFEFRFQHIRCPKQSDCRQYRRTIVSILES
jgi:hypothetical protein